MKIEIYFFNKYKTVKAPISKAYVDRGFLKVIDMDDNVHCYNCSDIQHYHILHEPGGDLLSAIRRASQSCQ